MDQVKIGKFIASCRKEQGMTQSVLAERLGISDRAVSKWETGRSMPDSSIMLELCGYLKINVNELLSGEKLNMENYNLKAEENLLQMRKHEEENNRRLLRMELVVGLSGTFAYILFVPAAIFCAKDWLWRTVFIFAALAFFAVGLICAMKIEREVGYYKCSCCGHVYVPTKSSTGWQGTVFATDIWYVLPAAKNVGRRRSSPKTERGTMTISQRCAAGFERGGEIWVLSEIKQRL